MSSATVEVIDTKWNPSEWTRDVWIGDWLIRAVTTDNHAGDEYVEYYYQGPKGPISNAWCNEDDVPMDVLRQYDEYIDANPGEPTS